jgi:hypothetical protein
MRPTVKVTATQIREALKVTEGNVAKSARVLGLARNNLYKRLASMGIDPETYRGNSATSTTEAPTVTPQKVTGITGVVGVVGAHGGASVSAGAIFTPGRRARNFRNVTQATTERTDETEAGEARKLRQPRTVYLRPDQWREIDGAVFDLAAKRRQRQSPSKIEEEFHDRYFAKFLAEELGTPKRGNGKKGGTE